MSTSLTPHDAPTFAPGTALLSLVRQDAAEAPIELSGEPLTIGAGPRCMLRLSGAGLRPLHCVVTPTESGPVVRRWAEGTRINGEDFTESPLAAGDRLTVGDAEFQVIESQPEGAFPEEPSDTAEPETSDDFPAELADPHPLDVQPVEALEEIEAEVASLVDDRAIENPETCEEVSPYDPDESSESDESSFFHRDLPAEPTPDGRGVEAASPENLFQDWAPAEEATPTETPSTETPSADFFPVDQIAEADEIAEAVSEPELSADDLWGVATPSSPAEGFLAEATAGEEDAAAAWQAEFESPRLPTEDPGEAPSVDAIASFASIPPADLAPLAAPSETAPAAWRGRLTAGRERVRRLTHTVRECRERITTLENEVIDHAETRARLETQLAEAIEAAETVTQELALLSEQAASPVSTENPPALAHSAADPEQPLASRDQEPTAEPAPVETPGESADLPAEESPASDLWGIDQPHTEHDQDVAAEPAPVETPKEQPVIAAEDSPANDLWEIEQLASLMPGEQPLWGAASEESANGVAPAAEEPVADEPAQALLEEIAEEPRPEGSLWDDSLTSEATLQPSADPIEEIVEAATADFEEPQPQHPVEQESFLERYAHLLPDDDEPVAPAEPLLAQEPEQAVEVGVAEEEDSIDDYMKQLMERVRGGGVSDDAAKPLENPIQADSIAPAETPAEEPAPAPEPVVPIKDLSELKRSSTNEPPTDMVALRSLANQSARHALNVAAKKENRERATLKLTVSAVALGCGAMAAITAANPFKLQFVIGLMAAGFGGWFGLRTLRGCSSKNAVDQLRDSLAE